MWGQGQGNRKKVGRYLVMRALIRVCYLLEVFNKHVLNFYEIQVLQPEKHTDNIGGAIKIKSLRHWLLYFYLSAISATYIKLT